MTYEGKLKTKLYWWITKNRPFVINEEYQIDLLFVDTEKLSAKILITNLKDNTQNEQEVAINNSSF
jgi:hypothetical protein